MCIRDRLIGDAAARFITGLVGAAQSEQLAFFQLHFFIGKCLEADLRAFGVQKGGHRQGKLPAQGVEAVKPFLLLFMGAVGEIESGHIHACLHHPAQDGRIVTGGAQGTDNFCFSQDVYKRQC